MESSIGQEVPITNAQRYKSNTRTVNTSVRKVSPYKSLRDSSVETPHPTDTFVTNTNAEKSKSKCYDLAFLWR